MLPASNQFKTVAKSLVKTPCAKLTIDDGTIHTLTDKQLQSFDTERSLCVSDTFTLGSTVSSKLAVKVLTSALNSVIMNGAKVTPYMGYVINGVETFIQQPTYYIDGSTVKNEGLFTSFEAYDSFMEPWMDESISLDYNFDATATPRANVIALAASYDAVTWDYSALPDTGTTPVLIDTTMSVREVIGRIAIAAGCNCMMEPNNTLTFRYPHTIVDEILTTRNYKSSIIDGADTTYVTYLQAGDDENLNQYPSDALVSQNTVRNTGLTLDNTYLVDNETATLQLIFSRFATMTVPAIFSVNYFGYQGHSIDIMGLPYLEPGDLIQFTDTLNNTYNLCPLTVKQSYTGGLTTSIGATTISQENKTQGTMSANISVATSSIKSQVTNLENKMTAIYGTCHTSAGTAAKVVSDLPSFDLYTGVAITVQFEFVNNVANPTLNVNGSGAYPIYANQAALSYPSAYDWKAGQYVGFVFANNAWHIIGANPANFCGFISDGSSGRILQISTNANASGAHTDIGADYIALKTADTQQMRIDQSAITIGNSPNRMVLNSAGVAIEGGASTVTLTSKALTLQQGSNESSKTTLTASQLETPIVQHTQTKFVNVDAPAFTYVMEHRSNGHLSWKAISNS